MKGRKKKGPFSQALDDYLANRAEFATLPEVLQELVTAAVKMAKKDSGFLKEVVQRLDGPVPKEDVTVAPAQTTVIVQQIQAAPQRPVLSSPPQSQSTSLPGSTVAESRIKLPIVQKPLARREIEESEVERLPTKEDDGDDEDE